MHMTNQENLSEAIPVRFTPSDLAAIHQAAADDERKVSDYIRITMRRALRESGYLRPVEPATVEIRHGGGITPEQERDLLDAAERMGVTPR